MTIMTLNANFKDYVEMHSIVVLNRNYEYFTEVNVRKVLKWIVKEKIEVIVSKEDEEIRAVEFRIKMPMVVRLIHFIGYKNKRNSVSYNDHTVFSRDNNRCQYYHHDENGKKYIYQCTEGNRTIDHVIPRSKGGETSFVNCVCCCKICNGTKKKNMTPKEAGMELIKVPRIPTIKKGDMAVFKFVFNPHKQAHHFYMETILNKKFSTVVE